MSAFIVKGSKEVKRIVTLFPKQTCSCPSTGECYHKLATKINLGMVTGKEKAACNLTILVIKEEWKIQKRKKMW